MRTTRVRPFRWHIEIAEKHAHSDFSTLPPKETTVAIIDTGIDVEHPNLKDAMAAPQVDFGPALNGVVYGTSKKPDLASSELDELINNLPTSDSRNSLENLLKKGVDVLDCQDPSTLFGSHGTGCAGLIAGRPATGALPYMGMNEKCKLISYATPFSHEYMPIIMALCHAYLGGADIIYMPRAVPDIDARAKLTDLTPEFGTRIDLSNPRDDVELSYQNKADQSVYKLLHEQQLLFEAVLKLIAENKYLVLAAGNGGLQTFEYPASLFSGKDDAYIVGAQNSNGHFSSYSSGRGEQNTTWMLSDDAPALNADVTSINTREFSGSELAVSKVEGISSNSFSPWQILSLDVRGGYGSASGPLDDPAKELEQRTDAGLYANIGGTSAASAIVVGLLSRLISPGGGRLRGELPKL